MKETASLLIEKIGTPFYLFDEMGFIRNYKKLESTFKVVYPKYHISYSYKTNYTPFICYLVKSLGGYAEVVSDMEYLLAKKIGYNNNQIVYNGPSKGQLMYEHLDNGGILNIDSLDEARKIVEHVRLHCDKYYTVGLRINMAVGGDFISRFGLVPQSEDLIETINTLKEVENLKLIGLHCHISRSRGLEAWAKRIEIMLKAADDYIDGVPQYISLGSGMYADMPIFLRKQFGGDTVPTYEDYAECAIRPFAEHYKNIENKPILFTEPGTTVVSRYLNFVSRVLYIKEIRGRNIVNMDGDFHNLGEICLMKKLPVTVIHGGKEQKKYANCDIMGSTCLEQDILYSQFEQPIAEDDALLFNNVGGYSIVFKPQFIKPNCAMYVKRNDGSLKEIMRAETFDDVFGKFDFKF